MPSSSRFPQRDVTWRTGGPSVHASGDGLEGNYSAILHTAPSGGTCKVVIPALDLTNWRTAYCSEAFTGSIGDRVLVSFDENKKPWVLSPTGVNPTEINGHAVPLTGSAWIAPTPLNSWTNIGSGFETLGYLKDPLGRVYTKGSITGGANNSIAWQYPVGARPGATVRFSGWDTLGSWAVDIDVLGNATVRLGSGASGISLDVVNFLAEN